MRKTNQPVVSPVSLFTMVGKSTRTLDYPSRQTIYSEGDKADAMFYIQNGYVKLTVESGSGKKAVLAILGHGDFFGESCFGKQALRTCTATAIEPSTISRVNRSAVVRNIQQHPGLAQMFISHLLVRLRRMEDAFVDQIFSSSEKRLARILLLLAGIGAHNKAEPVPFVVNQGTLAEMVGTTRSRVSYFMNGFREKGFIDYNGSIRVHKSLRSFLRRK